MMWMNPNAVKRHWRLSERMIEMLELLDRFGGWLEWQIDHNDYLFGFIAAFYIFFFCWVMGIIDVVMK